jgi:hypothetical protein
MFLMKTYYTFLNKVLMVSFGILTKDIYTIGRMN